METPKIFESEYRFCRDIVDILGYVCIKDKKVRLMCK